MATQKEWRRYMRSTDVHAERKSAEREQAREERQRLIERKPLDTAGRRVLKVEGADAGNCSNCDKLVVLA